MRAHYDLLSDSQIADRTSPGLLDLVTAPATGIAGALALSRKDVAARRGHRHLAGATAGPAGRRPRRKGPRRGTGRGGDDPGPAAPAGRVGD
ncbi:DUF389 domain-containing protein [Streptomyces anulatus]|uniref:DUF389 domain-containing protein n=1 Tax=Streptomyces anulatus TaxID=1892 RepID=UPI0027E351D8|nr:DUF389 domain-containing protein [Streptomyces anulatus]